MLVGLLMLACNAPQGQEWTETIKQGATLEARFPAPAGFARTEATPNSFAQYLRTLPLKPHGTQVKYYNGQSKPGNGIYAAVVDMEISARDLQQCADAVMRLRGEYLFAQKRYKDIHFNFLSDGKPRYFTDYAKGDYSYKRFRSYMDWVFAFANTASLKGELTPVPFAQLQIGDVFIQRGNPYGHAIIVVDVATNAQGEKQFMLAQSYMPAQETQILLNPASAAGSPWYSTNINGQLHTPEWTFELTDLRRFSD